MLYQFNHKTSIESLYEYFYQKIYNLPKYSYNDSKINSKYIESFLNIIDKKYKLPCIGKEFLINYFLFQFDYWSQLTLKSYNQTINPQYIIGKKAFQRWSDRDSSYDWQLESLGIIKKYKISLRDLKSLLNTQNVEDNNFEDKERKRFLNTERGFIHCIERTTLYNKRSSVCLFCNFKSDCEKLLKRNYPKIYEIRNAIKR